MPTAVPPAASSNSADSEARIRPTASPICRAQPDHSCPTVSGTASCKCVRPILTTSFHASAFAVIALASASAFDSRCCSSASTAAMCIAVGKLSFEDCPMLTSSFGCTGALPPIAPPSSWMARFASTSFRFMFDWVPEPVCQT